MRVGILTSWNVRCGVAQYSARYADALAQIGHTPVILALRAGAPQFDLPEETGHLVVDVGYCGHYNPPSWQPVLDASGLRDIARRNLDAIHVQYQCMIVRQEQLAALRTATAKPLAITFHDNALLPSFPAQAFDLRYAHREGVGIGATIIPFPIEDRPPIVRSFGLGRSQSEIIAPICERNGWIFEDIGPSQEWLSHEDLIAWLRGSDAIVAWYPPEPRAGASLAARTAIAARRPLITNDTEWFAEMPLSVGGNCEGDIYRKVSNPAELESHLRGLFWRRYVDERSWPAVATRFVDDYETA